MTRRRRTLLAAAAVVGTLVLGGCGDSSAQRRAEVAARGRTVMPFDLARTTHVFTDLADGGVQTVTANDAADNEQIGLIRGHLQDEQTRFVRGDFSDPEAIHGPQMPGLAELKAAGGRVHVRYKELGDGARLWYSTEDPALVDALHAWFKAQSSDHGSEHHMTG